jgi:Uma2 family endonuclease
VAVVPLGDYSHGHPETAHLVIEVADSSTSTDRTVKAELYARGGIAEYWLVDLAARAVDVFRRPEGGRYVTVTRVDAAGGLASLAFPDVVFAVKDILPTA